MYKIIAIESKNEGFGNLKELKELRKICRAAVKNEPGNVDIRIKLVEAQYRLAILLAKSSETPKKVTSLVTVQVV